MQEIGEEQENFLLTCGESISFIVRGILTIAYKLIVQGVTLVLAVMIRKVKIPSLDDAKYVTILAYVTTALYIIIIINNVALDKYQNVYVSIYAASTIAFAGSFLGLLFIPKVNKGYQHSYMNV